MILGNSGDSGQILLLFMVYQKYFASLNQPYPWTKLPLKNSIKTHVVFPYF